MCLANVCLDYFWKIFQTLSGGYSTTSPANTFLYFTRNSFFFLTSNLNFPCFSCYQGKWNRFATPCSWQNACWLLLAVVRVLKDKVRWLIPGFCFGLVFPKNQTKFDWYIISYLFPSFSFKRITAHYPSLSLHSQSFTSSQHEVPTLFQVLL